MAKGSVRKKGKKWYYRFYVEDASGNLVQKEFTGTESKSETEKLLRQAMEDYEEKKFIAKAENTTLGDLLDVWAEEDLKTGSLSNGAVENYLQTIQRIKKHPISKQKLKTITSDHLQKFMDLLVFGRTEGNFTSNGFSKNYMRSYSAVLHGAFRFAVFPKQLITFNPMDYVVIHSNVTETELFAEDDESPEITKPLTREEYQKLIDFLGKRSKDAILPIQIAYFTGLRIGEVAGLTWQDSNLDEQYLTVRRSIRYNGARHTTEIGPTKRGKVRIVDFGDILTDILRKAKKEQHKNRLRYGTLYHHNYYLEVKEKNRIHYEFYHLSGEDIVPPDYQEIDFVCKREDGSLEIPATISDACRSASKHMPELEGFHFHMLRHTYTTNMLTNGAMPKDVQEMLGHSDDIYAHGSRDSKKSSAKLLDKVVG